MTAGITRDFRLQTPEQDFSDYAAKELDNRKAMAEGLDELVYQKAVELVMDKLAAMHEIPENSDTGEQLFKDLDNVEGAL